MTLRPALTDPRLTADGEIDAALARLAQARRGVVALRRDRRRALPRLSPEDAHGRLAVLSAQLDVERRGLAGPRDR